MSDAALGALLEKQIIPIVQRSTSRAKGKRGTRFDLERYPGQIFRFDWKAHVKVLSKMHANGQFLNDPNTGKAVSDEEIKKHLLDCFNVFKKTEESKVIGYSRTLESHIDGKPVTVTVTKERFKELEAEAKKSSTRYWTMVCRNYTKVQEFTTPSKANLAVNLNRQLNVLDNKVSNKTYGKADASRFNFDQEVGHGFGKGMASSGYAAGRAAGKLQKIASSNRIVRDVIEKDQIKGKLQKITKRFGVDLEHAFKLAENDFAKDFFLVLTSQDKDTNRAEGFDEASDLRDLQQVFEEIILEVKASPSLRDSVEEQIFSYFESQPKLQVAGKRSRKSIKSKSKTRTKTFKVQSTKRTPIITGGVQLQVSKIKKKRSKSRNPKPVSPLGILMLLNKKLPQKVQQNMGLPGLANRTGRFAASVQAVNIQDSKLGVPMIDYTYQKNPYQVFETSRGQRPWSSLERDPRTLIDESIRELAAEMALGKFTTRRV